MSTQVLPRKILVVALAAAVMGSTVRDAGAAPMRQTKNILAAGFVDIHGGSDPNCPGCDGVYSAEDQARATSDPLPTLEFVVTNGAGQELGRAFSTPLLGVQRAPFTVPDEEVYFLELVSDPSPWQLCPTESRRRMLVDADFRLGNVTEAFRFTQGCQVVPPDPTASPTLPPGVTPSPTVPGEPGVEPTAAPPRAPSSKSVPPPGPFGQIRGIAFIDLNQDGAIGAGEPGLNDVKVNLGGGGLEIHQLTPGDGTFNFPGLGPGSYDVFIDPGPEWKITTPKKYTVSVNGNDVAGIDFGLIRHGDAAAAEVHVAAAPRTGRQLVIPGAGTIGLPDTGLASMPVAGTLALLTALLGGLAAAGFASERRGRRR